MDEQTTEQCSIGVGDGSGNLFVHGSYDSVKAVQRIILRNEELERQNMALREALIRMSIEHG